MEMLSKRFGCGRPEVSCGARPPEDVIHHHNLDDRTHFARGKSQVSFAGMKVHSCIPCLIPQPLYEQQWGLERPLVPITRHGHPPLQAASSSASRWNKAGVSVVSPGRGVKDAVLWQPSVIPTGISAGISGSCETALFMQLQWNRANSSLTVWERSSITQPTVFL